ncbi:MAG: endonuclease/exonuclease/phosphatase family protein [Verrucomicrobia bacterium]|nr:endonuclease/exonuclease/phosphatase family protein [Verrucomicrobiota bacterium]
MRLFWLVGGLLLAMVTAWAGLPMLPVHETQPILAKPSRFPIGVATWNLQWFPGNRPEPRAAERVRHQREVAKMIRQLGVDLLLVQEVVDREALEKVARDYPWRVFSNFQRAGDENPDLPVQNVAILSKVPLRESWEVGFHALPLTPDRPVRGFLGARLGTKKNGMTVYTLHLKSNRGGREASTQRRERAMEYLQKDWEKRGLDPEKDAILVAGDFNCSLRNPEFSEEKTIRALLQQGWRSATAEIPWPEAATVKPDPMGKYPAADFDHILLSPAWAKAVALLRSEPLRGRSYAGFKAGVFQDSNVPSDHWPVVLRFQD